MPYADTRLYRVRSHIWRSEEGTRCIAACNCRRNTRPRKRPLRLISLHVLAACPSAAGFGWHDTWEVLVYTCICCIFEFGYAIVKTNCLSRQAHRRPVEALHRSRRKQYLHASLKHPQLPVRFRVLLEKTFGSAQIPQPVLRQMHHRVFNLMDIHALQIVIAMQELVVHRKRMLNI